MVFVFYQEIKLSLIIHVFLYVFYFYFLTILKTDSGESALLALRLTLNHLEGTRQNRSATMTLNIRLCQLVRGRIRPDICPMLVSEKCITINFSQWQP